jgi:hypothetical protein
MCMCVCNCMCQNFAQTCKFQPSVLYDGPFLSAALCLAWHADVCMSGLAFTDDPQESFSQVHTPSKTLLTLQAQPRHAHHQQSPAEVNLNSCAVSVHTWSNREDTCSETCPEGLQPSQQCHFLQHTRLHNRVRLCRCCMAGLQADPVRMWRTLPSQHRKAERLQLLLWRCDCTQLTIRHASHQASYGQPSH